MRLTFIHDHKFIYKNGEYFSSGKFSNETLNRYFIHPIDKIQVIGRIQYDNQDIRGLAKTTSKKISVNPIKFLKSKKDFITKRRKVLKFLEKNISEEDIVIVRIPSEVAYIAIKILERKNIAYGIELAGDPWDSLWYHGSFIGKFMAYINRCKVKKYMKNSKNNMYVTKHYLQERYPTKNNAFSASNVFIKEVKNNYQNHQGNVKKIGLIGSLDTAYKGLDTALLSLTKIKTDYMFEVVGNGPQEKWKKRISELGMNNKVILKGTLSNKELNEWFSTLDLYIQPSYTEGLPRALIEAMSHGIPCLGSKVGGIPELLDFESLHIAKDYKTLAKQIVSVLTKPLLREEMSGKNIKTARRYLNENIQREREKFIKSVYREYENYES